MDFTSLIEEAVTRTGLPQIATRYETILELAENHLNRAIKGASKSITEITITTDASGDYALPSDYNGIKSVYKNRSPLHNSTQEYMDILEGKNGYRIVGSTLKTNLPNTELSISYYASLPTLRTNDTNWLSSDNAEIYIYAIMWQGLTQASMQAKDQNEMALFTAKILPARSYLDQLVSEFKENDRGNRIAGMRVNVGAVQ